MCKTSIYEARNNFSALVKSAEEGEVIALTRYDKPVAVIISYAEYEQFEDSKPSLLSALDKLKKEYADVVDDSGFDFTPSRECPDYSKDPWA
ncbi:MAG: type II toxin-antitoxin system Phd/YefM family antitoxin [Treponema sp.]|jgi:antitoxin Phd|uniref:type II toxin-antitoxin system Phd/YefM family antitoxin n=1 Tax=Treponema sp. TaxID=166 RepID=UPI002A91A106|nr:type II toxin-antitoxin system Phd/YefM family antitoxin [Treponema sp.]MDY6398573.1 type II toxin-antitoxin system Phd/YefM family antitoxin [Treponema sp.]